MFSHYGWSWDCMTVTFQVGFTYSQMTGQNKGINALKMLFFSKQTCLEHSRRIRPWHHTGQPRGLGLTVSPA